MHSKKVEQAGPKKDWRFRIEHAQHLTPAAIKRFGPLGVVASMQPYHAVDDGRWAEKRIGAERLKGTYAFRSLIDSGAHLTFGSDWPVAPLDPLTGIYAAVTRRTADGANPNGWLPQQKITVAEALRSYTAENAWAGFQEGKVGVLKQGALADFAVLSKDLFAGAADRDRQREGRAHGRRWARGVRRALAQAAQLRAMHLPACASRSRRHRDPQSSRCGSR